MDQKQVEVLLELRCIRHQIDRLVQNISKIENQATAISESQETLVEKFNHWEKLLSAPLPESI